MPIETLYSTAKAAAALGVAKRPLLKWRKEGRIAYVTYPDGSFRFRESTLNYFIGSNTTQAIRRPPEIRNREAAKRLTGRAENFGIGDRSA